MVDELNDEREVEMDRMTDRLRALEADRDDADAQAATLRADLAWATKEMAKLQEAQAAALKRAEEAERRFREAMLKKADDLSRLLGQLSEAQAREGRYREIVEMYLDDDCCVLGPDASCPTGTPCRYCVATAALSPSPVSATGEVLPPEPTCPKWEAGGWGPDTVGGEVSRKALPSPVSTRCPVCRAPAGQPHKMSCRPHDRAVKHYVEPSPVSGAAAPTLTAAMVCPHTPQYACPRCQPERFASGVAAKEPGKDGGR